MASPNRKRNYKPGSITTALWIFIALASVLVFLSPFTHLWPLGYGFCYLFGFFGYWVILPTLLVAGVLVVLRSALPKRNPARLIVGVVLLYLGLMILLSHLGMNGKERFSDMSPFTDVIELHQGDTLSSLGFDTKLGGGMLGYLLSGTLNELLSYIGVYCVSIGLIAISLIVLLWHLFGRFFSSLRAGRALAKARRSAAKEAATANNVSSANWRAPEPVAAPLDGGGEAAAERPALSRMALNRQAASQPSAVQPTAAEQVLDPYEEATPLADASSPQNNQPFLQSGLQEATFDFSSSKSTLGASNASTESPEKLAAGNVLTPLSEDPTPAPAVQPAAQANSYQAPRRAIPTSDISNVEASFSLADSASSEPPLDDSEVVPEPFSAVSAPSFAQNPSLASSPQPSVRSRPSVQPTRPEQSFSAPEQTSAGGLHAASETSSSRQPSNSRQASSAADPAAMTPSQSVQQNISQPNIQAAGFSNVKTPIAPQDIPEVPAVNASATYEAPKPDIMPEVSDPSAQPKATRRSHYDFPGINLLTDYPPNPDDAQNKADCQSRCQLINQTFTDLGVGASVVSYTIGPSVTRYDVQTNPDVSVSSVSHVVTDISVRLGGVATRYEQLVRGKTTSGLEIVNRTTTTVSFKEVLTALPKADEDHNLFIPFGKSISGDIVYADLSEFPHMLVSGSTGSGKSIFMHGVIMTLIMRNRPEDLKLVVVDPKRVEMAKYKDIPHLLCPIIKEASAAKICFDKLIEEMERRYTLFELSGVSNIRQFNKEYAPSAGVEKLPFIVVVVDEYADLVDSCKDLGERVVRLAQKARAAGIHLVIATQRPSVNVITGVIKANLPVRVALSVASATDSITILGEGGAEDLAGHGDMLVDCSLVSRTGFTRLQGCFVNNKEIKDVADFIHSQIPTVYDPRFLDLVDHAEEEKQAVLTAPTAAEERASKSEDLYSYVKDTIMAREYTSISQIQREFSVGFPRAGKIFAQLQAEGIVASVADSASSSKGCRVLVHGKSSKQSENPGTTEQSSVSAAPAASMDK